MNTGWSRFSRWQIARPSREAGKPGGDGPPTDPASAAPLDFDALAQGLAEGMPRREALRRLGHGLAVVLLSFLSQDRAWGQGSRACARFCTTVFPPGVGRSQCLRDAAQERGLCAECGADPRRLCQTGTGGLVCCSRPNSCCDSACRDLTTDPDHCGGCESACAAGQVCLNGQCQPCLGGTTFCEGSRGRVCCSSAPSCCDGICCSSSQICIDGVCCSSTSVCYDHGSLGGTPTLVCCAGTCVPSALGGPPVCCPNGATAACFDPTTLGGTPSVTCCEGSCVPIPGTNLPVCCPSGSTSACPAGTSITCCQAGEQCIPNPSGGGGLCCDPTRVCFNGIGANASLTCCAGKCLPSPFAGVPVCCPDTATGFCVDPAFGFVCCQGSCLSAPGFPHPVCCPSGSTSACVNPAGGSVTCCGPGHLCTDGECVAA